MLCPVCDDIVLWVVVAQWVDAEPNRTLTLSVTWCSGWMQSQIEACERKLRNSNGTRVFLERLTLHPVAEEESDHSG